MPPRETSKEVCVHGLFASSLVEAVAKTECRRILLKYFQERKLPLCPDALRREFTQHCCNEAYLEYFKQLLVIHSQQLPQPLLERCEREIRDCLDNREGCWLQ